MEVAKHRKTRALHSTVRLIVFKVASMYRCYKAHNHQGEMAASIE
jgi:hypothetical protein